MFVSERVRVETDVARADGAPATPSRVIWGGDAIDVAAVLETWKTLSEGYVRRHYFRVLATDGRELTLYCERGAPAWYLYAVD